MPQKEIEDFKIDYLESEADTLRDMSDEEFLEANGECPCCVKRRVKEICEELKIPWLG